ncbi:TPA: radical SAM protein [Salmonella enterica]|uniref:Radical SAM protein n=1 Tax=Salmonella enterica TaxID=28901 RepID=A0A765BJI2_SALER|nr:radical SAM protein [Salmonella enterica]HAG5356287.1 radical SAM protein [Salmonella enterica]
MIDSIQIHLTNKCNRKCYHCLFSSSRIHVKELHISSWIDFFEKNSSFISSGCNINIFGGEPYLYKHIFDLINYLNRKKYNVGITTNASQIDIIKRSIEIGIKRLSVDVSSAEMMTHNELKPDTFINTVNLLKTLNIEDVKLYINIIIHAGNYNQIETTLDFISEFNIDNISIYSLTEIGQAKYSNFYMIDEKIWSSIKARVIKWIELNTPNFSIIWENSYLEKPEPVNFKLCSDKNTKTIDIRCDGNVYFCCLLMAQHLTELNNDNCRMLGNIKDDTIKDIINKRKKLIISQTALCPAIKELSIANNKKKHFWCPYDWEYLSVKNSKSIGYMGNKQ